MSFRTNWLSPPLLPPLNVVHICKEYNCKHVDIGSGEVMEQGVAVAGMRLRETVSTQL